MKAKVSCLYPGRQEAESRKEGKEQVHSGATLHIHTHPRTVLMWLIYIRIYRCTRRGPHICKYATLPTSLTSLNGGGEVQVYMGLLRKKRKEKKRKKRDRKLTPNLHNPQQAIDLMTRRLVASGQAPVTVGMYFSLGHSTFVSLPFSPPFLSLPLPPPFIPLLLYLFFIPPLSPNPPFSLESSSSPPSSSSQPQRPSPTALTSSVAWAV